MIKPQVYESLFCSAAISSSIRFPSDPSDHNADTDTQTCTKQTPANHIDAMPGDKSKQGKRRGQPPLTEEEIKEMKAKKRLKSNQACKQYRAKVKASSKGTPSEIGAKEASLKKSRSERNARHRFSRMSDAERAKYAGENPDVVTAWQSR